MTKGMMEQEWLFLHCAIKFVADFPPYRFMDYTKLNKTTKSQELAMQINIGISEPLRQQIATGLSKLLADSYTLYLKTQNFHWNVSGAMFTTLHLLFEGQYTDLATAVDEIAERIRALGYPAPGSYRQFSKLTQIKEAEENVPAKDMIQQLLADQETIVHTAREVIAVVQQAGDEPTLELLTERMRTHEKNAWMLRSLLEN